MKKAATKHVKITSFPLGIYNTLKFTYVTKYNPRPHKDTQTEGNEYEVTNCNQLLYNMRWQTATKYSMYSTPLHKQAKQRIAS